MSWLLAPIGAVTSLEHIGDVNLTGLASGEILQWNGSAWVNTTVAGGEINDLTAAVTWADIPDANVPQSAVTQHQASLTILEGQITDGSILGRLAASETITGKWVAGANGTTGAGGGSFNITASNPSINIDETDGATDERNTLLFWTGGDFQWRMYDDAWGAFNSAFVLSRTGNALTTMTINGALVADSYGGILEANLLDKTAAETVSAGWEFTGFGTGSAAIEVENALPRIAIVETDAAVDNGVYYIDANAEQFAMSVVNDARTTVVDFFDVDRTGTVVDAVTITATSIVAAGNLFANTFGGIASANLLDKTATETITGEYTFDSGLSLGSNVGASTVDLSDHIALFGTTWGFNITASSMNAVANGANVLSFTTSGVDVKDDLRTNGNIIDSVSSVYQDIRTSSDAAGGIRLYDNSTVLQGYLYFDADEFGLLNNAGSWILRNTQGSTAIELPGEITFTSVAASGSYPISINSTVPFWEVIQSGAALNEKNWRFGASSGAFFVQSRTDADGAGSTFFTLNRTAAAGDDISIGSGIQLLADDGAAAAPGIAFATASTTGFYEAGTAIGVAHSGSLQHIFASNRFETNQAIYTKEGVIADGTVSDVGQVGVFAFIDEVGGTARLGSYNYDAGPADWQPLLVQGSALELSATSGNVDIHASGGNIDLNDATYLVDGSALRIYDSTNTDYLAFSHDGTDFNIAGTTTTDLNFSGLSNIIFGDCQMTSTGAFVSNTSGEFGQMIHTGVYLSISTGGTTVRPVQLNPGTSYVRIESAMQIAEQAAADTNIIGYGQLWVKNTTPCQLWFTDDAGTDTQIV